MNFYFILIFCHILHKKLKEDSTSSYSSVLTISTLIKYKPNLTCCHVYFNLATKYVTTYM